MDILEVLKTFGVPALVAGIGVFLFQLLTNRRFARKDKTEAEEHEQKEKQEELELRTLTLEKQFEQLKCEIQNNNESIQFMSIGIQSLLRDRMIQMFNHYNENGFLPIYARENFDKMFTAYEGLGGNGTTRELVKEIRKLPVKKDEKLVTTPNQD